MVGGGRVQQQQQVIKKNKTHTSSNLGVDIWAHFGLTAAAIKNMESPSDQKWVGTVNCAVQLCERCVIYSHICHALIDE